VLVGGIWDASGSYPPAFVLMVGFALAGAVCAFWARPPVPEAVDAKEPLTDFVI
jgi:hypothetical protein